ncbi:hypothetical protein Natoc_3193 [Natronococcus occultus SP4]|uniref:Uncharacterized protein n=1 Tax=Natronococcus occultus SP4 TaxID=694430 RepID=L0K0W6_9EURY|nr:hypothetical protein Natoc_3193 [Natronococcus occultus SP4]
MGCQAPGGTRGVEESALKSRRPEDDKPTVERRRGSFGFDPRGRVSVDGAATPSSSPVEASVLTERTGFGAVGFRQADSVADRLPARATNRKRTVVAPWDKPLTTIRNWLRGDRAPASVERASSRSQRAEPGVSRARDGPIDRFPVRTSNRRAPSASSSTSITWRCRSRALLVADVKAQSARWSVRCRTASEPLGVKWFETPSVSRH